MATDPSSNIVIIGGGIIGVCTAYYLSIHPSSSSRTITILEGTAIAAAASGRAGGLVAKWAFPTCLAEPSFRLHADLAKQFNGAERWGYRKVTAGQVDAIVGGKMKTKRGKKWPTDLNWLDGGAVSEYDVVATDQDTAQVHPKLFTQAIAAEAEKNGVKIIIGKATRINSSSDVVQSVEYIPQNSSSTETISTPTVILAAGPWSSTLIPSLPLETARAHSLVIRTPDLVSPYALFTSVTKDGHESTPEIYARPDGTIYTCGETDTLLTLPESASDVQVDQSRCDELFEQVSGISKLMSLGKLETRQACYLPNVIGGGGPLVGHTKVKGLIVATGHTCWGIQNSAMTGKVISEIVFDGAAKSISTKTLNPKNWGI